MELITLLALVFAIFLGFIRKVNTGLISIGVAYIVGYGLVGMSGKEIIAGFPTSLFFMLLGMTLLFSIAKSNGTMEYIARKFVSLTGGKTKLIPILFFVFSAVAAAVGPGPIVITALMMPIAMAVAKTEDISDILIATIVISGSLAGGLSPLAASGIIASNLAVEIGIDNYTPIFICCIIAGIIQGIACYIVFGGHKLKNKKGASSKLDKMSLHQVYTSIVILGVIIGILVFKLDIGLTAFVGGALLLVLGAAKQDEAIKGIAWPTLLLVAGVALLVNVVNVSGGIDMLAAFLASIMNGTTASGILAITGGLMSSVSSASGVVMPTLIPTVPTVVAELGGSVSPSALVAGIVWGAHAVTYSPLSTLGALAMANVTDRVDKNKIFNALLISAIASTLFAGLLGVVGLYGFFG